MNNLRKDDYCHICKEPLKDYPSNGEPLVHGVVCKACNSELSQRLEISPALALDLFYRSKTCAQLHDKRTGLYLMSNGYIADDFIYEKQRGY